MRSIYVKAMDKLYLFCIGFCILSIIVMTVLIATGVVMRYFFEIGAHYAEPVSIFFAIQLTFYGAAACYRAQSHLRLEYFVRKLPDSLQAVPHYAVHLLMAAIAVFMLIWGASLSEQTFFQSYPEFRHVRVGLVYTAIPIAGLITLLFVIEAAVFGPPPKPEAAGAEAGASH